MFLNLVLFENSTFYIWSAFILTLSLCSILYLKTKKDLNKFETKYKKEIQTITSYELENEYLKETKDVRKISSATAYN